MVIDDPLGDGSSAAAGGWRHGTAAQQGRERPSSQQRKETQGMETSAAAPTIHVTIGRIEVRAMPAPASAPRGQASRSGPALSLQDYLQQNKRRGS